MQKHHSDADSLFMTILGTTVGPHASEVSEPIQQHGIATYCITNMSRPGCMTYRERQVRSSPSRTNILVELSMTEASARHMLVAISDVREVWSSIIKPSKKKLHPMSQERLVYSN